MDGLSLEEFRKDLELRGLAKVTIDRLYRTTKRYLTWAQKQGINTENARKDDLRAYLAYLRSKKMRYGSISATFVALNSWYDYLVECEKLQVNPVPYIQKRYLRTYKEEVRQRQLISVEDASKMVRTTIDIRDRAILLVLFKTGIRRNELASLDFSDLDLQVGRITLKPTGKRSNRIVFFDDETSRALARWLKSRETRFKKGNPQALFISAKGTRLDSSSVNNLVRDAAIRVGLHDSDSARLEDHFGPHCCRHWNATHLLRAGMPRDYVKWLRGDAMKEAIDIYNHIDPDDVRKSYLAHVPQLGV